MDAPRLAGSLDVGGEPTALVLSAEGTLLVGLADGRVREIEPATRHFLADPFAPSGSAAAAAGGGAEWRLVIDRSGRIRQTDDRGLSEAVVTKPGPRTYEVRAAAISPSGNRLAVVLSYPGAMDHAIDLWDAEALCPIATLSPNLGPNDDCLRFDALAFSPDGSWLAAHGAGTRYGIDGDWCYGIDERFTLARARDGEVWLAADVAQAWTPREHRERSIVFEGERGILVGEYRIERPEAKVGYRNEPGAVEWWPEWRSRQPEVMAVDARGIVVAAEGEQAWQVRLGADREDDPMAEITLPGRAKAIVIAGGEAWFAIEGGGLVAWAMVS